MSRKKLTKQKKMSPLGIRIREIEKDSSMQRKDFAKKLGFSASYLTQLINGDKKNPSERFLREIEAQFNVESLWLSKGLGNKYKKHQKPSYGEPEKPMLSDEETAYRKGGDTEKRILLQMTSEILDSDTEYSRALETNIHAFHRAIENELKHSREHKEFKTKFKYLEKKIVGNA